MKLASLTMLLVSGAALAANPPPVAVWLDPNITDSSKCESPSCLHFPPDIIFVLMKHGFYFVDQSNDKVQMIHPSARSMPYSERWVTSLHDIGLPCERPGCFTLKQEDAKRLYNEFESSKPKETIPPRTWKAPVRRNDTSLDGFLEIEHRDKLQNSCLSAGGMLSLINGF